MKRFYKQASVQEQEGGFQIVLDGRPVKTPARAQLLVSSAGLAQAIADEWQSQEDEIDPRNMPLTALANAALDRVATARQDIIDQVTAFAAYDVLCYRAEHPSELVALQSEEWDPILRWLQQTYGVHLQITTGIAAVAQPEESLTALRNTVAEMTDFPLTGVFRLSQIYASAGLALAVSGRLMDAREALALSQLDEQYQVDKWGKDAEAEARRRTLLDEVGQVGLFLGLSTE